MNKPANKEISQRLVGCSVKAVLNKLLQIGTLPTTGNRFNVSRNSQSDIFTPGSCYHLYPDG
jgi:hypothetical protein